MHSPYSIAEETLPKSSLMRNAGYMNSPVRPGPNLYDSGAASKPQLNTQPFNNERLAQQTMMQNGLSAAPQAGVAAAGSVRSQVASASDQEVKAQQFLSTRASEALYANQSGSALMRLNAVMQSPDRDKFLNDIAVGKAMAQGLNPDLGQEVATARRYA